MAKKVYQGGYSSQDFQDWGREEGRPRKWKSEAERKRFARQQKALAEGRTLRGYRSYQEKTRTTKIFSKVDPDKIVGKYSCPKCGRFHKVDKRGSGYIDGDYYRFREGLIHNQGIITCESCGYQYPFEKKRIQETIWRAGSSTERVSRWKEKNEEEEDEEE